MAPRQRARVSRLRRALAVPLALWMLVALIVGGTHLADGVHARQADGGLLHVGPWVAGLSHAACDHHSPLTSLDRDSRPPATPDPCWLSRFAPATVNGSPAFEPARLAPPPGHVPQVSPRPPMVAVVLAVAPKTSPPA